jgi:hypothetical protein
MLYTLVMIRGKFVGAEFKLEVLEEICVRCTTGLDEHHGSCTLD